MPKKGKDGKRIVEVKEEPVKQGRPFAEKFFGGDLLASQCVALLRPNYRQCDLGELILGDPNKIGKTIVEIGEKMKEEGTFPGGHYIHEDSLEIKESIEFLRKALTMVTVSEFTELVIQSAKQAEAGYGSIGTWGPRFSALRWRMCTHWLATRAQLVANNSAGASFGTIDPKASAESCSDAKTEMFHWIDALIHEAPLLKVFDHDLLGYGVYMNKRAEPLPRGGNNEWFRRQMQYDLASMCRQVKELPPESLNRLEPRLHILRPYGEATWMLPPPEALRFILEKHGWVAEIHMPPIDNIPAKALIQGKVLHMDCPPLPEFDMKDPEIIAKLQRGEQLGKGDQEDGLPGAIHGSIALLFAGVVGVEKCENVRIYPSLLEVDDFFEWFLKYTTRLETLDLSDTDGVMDYEMLSYLPHAGPSLKFLDLEKCGLDGTHVDQLVDACEALTGLQHLDLANNLIDVAAATTLLAALAERRVDLQSIRLDGNPLGDTHEFRQDVAGLMAARGDQVVAGGELVLYLNVDGVRWFAEPRHDTLASRRRDDTLMMSATSLDEITQGAHDRNSALDRVIQEHQDPRTRSIVGRAMLQAERDANDKMLANPMLTLYHKKILNPVSPVTDSPAAPAPPPPPPPAAVEGGDATVATEPAQK